MMMATAWLLTLTVLVLLGPPAASTEQPQPPDLVQQQEAVPGAVAPEAILISGGTDAGNTIDGATGECDPLKDDCPQPESGQVHPQHLPTKGAPNHPSEAGQEKIETDEDMWRKKNLVLNTIGDKIIVDSIIDDDDTIDDEEYFEGSSISSESDPENGLGVAASVEGAASAAVPAHALDGGGAGGEGAAVNTTAGGPSPPETEKKKVPLREILLRLKPASLMDDEEREAAAATAADRGDQDGNATVAGTVEGRGLVLGGGLPSEDGGTANTSKRAVCAATATEDGVQLLNATGLQALVSPNANSTGRSQPAPCLLVFFFSPRCRFSATAAPAMTALARALQGAMPVYGVDSVQHHSINAQFGVMGTPQLVLFHNGYSVAHYNASSFTPDLLTSFLLHYTDHRMLEEIHVTEEDLKDGPLPLVAAPGGGWWLAAAWLLLGGVASRCFVKSALCHRLVEAVLNSWREAEAQHQHQD